MLTSFIQADGMLGQKRVAAWLRSKGLGVSERKYHSSYDLVVGANAYKVEVKCANCINGRWVFNIHRHNVVDESETDYYILRLEKVPGSPKASLHIVLKAPLNKPTICISLRTLFIKYVGMANNIEMLR